jgi:uncharacterized protein YukE
MPSHFDYNTVAAQGGVAWAKQVGTLLDPDAIQRQIDGYSAVNASLNQIIDTLGTANNQIQSTWTGTAATAASQTFTAATDHARTVVGTVDNTVTTLRSAKAASAQAKTALAAVPDEVPVPHAGVGASFVSGLLGEQNAGQIARAHNQAAQQSAAEVLNALSVSYGSAAGDLQSIAGTSTGSDTGFTAANTSTGAFDLGRDVFTDTRASAYSANTGNALTGLQGVQAPLAVAKSVIGQPNLRIPGSNPSHETLLATPESIEPIMRLSGIRPSQTRPEPMLVAPVMNLPTGSEAGSKHEGVFGETGFGNSLHTVASSGIAVGAVPVPMEEARSDEWVQPVVGGDESLLVTDSTPEIGSARVASAFGDSTDADDNSLAMMAGSGRRIGGVDERQERAQRPDYLKEDPEWWKSAKSVVPAIIE